jgi:hypothetical protein
MKTVKVAMGVAVTIAAGAAAYFALRGGTAEPNSMPQPVAAKNSLSFAPFANHDNSPPQANNSRPSVTASPRPYRERFAKATSYYDFVRDALPAAKAGDPEAQFYVSEALGYCEQGYSKWFLKRPAPDLPAPSLEEMIGKLPPHLHGVLRNVYGKCHDLMENNAAQWGTQEDWLAKATDAGLPAAQARAANMLLVNEEFHEPPGIHSKEQDPRTLLRSALQAKDPTALLVAGSILNSMDEMKNPRTNDVQLQETRIENRLAWWLLACSRGYDCSENGLWFGEVCASDATRCLPDHPDAVEYIHRVAADRHYSDLDQMAASLMAKVDAGAWNELGLGGS